MKRIELILIALITIIGSFSYAFGEEIADALDQGLTIPACGHINESETHLLNTTIGSNVTSASFILSWSEMADDLEMVLVSPSGMRVGTEIDEPVIYQRNASLIYYIVPYPEPGDWTAEIIAGSVPETGEDYCAFTVLDENEAAVEKAMSERSSGPGDEAQEIEGCAECSSR
jgi:hypothetical protein